MVDIFCIASGPSLNARDCDLIRQSGITSIAVNNSWKLAPSCKYLYAGDAKWWKAYRHEINISAERWTCSRIAAQNYGVRLHSVSGPYNSGMRAVQFALFLGFRSVGLLGYDCSLKNGLHWHGAHDSAALGNPNHAKIKKWHLQFAAVAVQARKRGAKIYNCSRETELTCFPLLTLEAALGC